MTPEQAKSASAAMFSEHAENMQKIASRGLEQTREWSAVGATIVDQIRTGESTVQGMVEKQRQEIAERLAATSREVVHDV